MVFSSHLFLFYFLPVALLLYYLLPHRGKHLGLAILSYLFYGWANPAFVVLMFGSTVVDYIAGLVISQQFRWQSTEPELPLRPNDSRSLTQKIALATSLCSNLALLGFFKYFNFFTESYDAVMASLGFSESTLDLTFRIVLPLGISFYTFQSMSYSIDVYRGHAKALRNFIDFACYVSMFPQLVAGPIVRFSEVDDQMRYRTYTLTKFTRGIAFFCLGMSKKVLLANPCGKVADTIFDAGTAQTLEAWFGAVAYAFQIYFDFSAYSDMAIGLGLMLGFVFPKNFDSPYLSESITDFWRRWHLSLSNWLRDYLYIPLGGNRLGAARTYVNLMTVMVLGGLWHGASWNFVIWGTIHGGMLALERFSGGGLFRFLPRSGRIAATFVVVLFSWVFFRAPDLESAVRYCAAMLGFGQVQLGAGLLAGIIYQPYYLISAIMAGVIVWTCPQVWDWTRSMTWAKSFAVVAAFWASIIVLSVQAYNPFIYFIF